MVGGEWGYPPSADYGLGDVVSSPSGVQGRAPVKNDFTAFQVCQNLC